MVDVPSGSFVSIRRLRWRLYAAFPFLSLWTFDCVRLDAASVNGLLGTREVFI